MLPALLSGELAVGPIGATRMACPDDIMTLERRYLEGLSAAVKYSFIAGNLAWTSSLNGVHRTMLFEPGEPSIP